jgi:hypothetical protein
LRSHSGHSERLSPKVAEEAEEAEEVVAAEAEVQEAQAVARLGPEQEQPELDRPVQDKLAVMRGKCDPARGPDHQVHRARQGPVRTISAIRERRAQKLGPTTLARGGADVGSSRTYARSRRRALQVSLTATNPKILSADRWHRQLSGSRKGHVVYPRSQRGALRF